MDKYSLVNFLRGDFNLLDVYKSIRKISGFNTWNIIKRETIGNRGLLLHVKGGTFRGYVLITFEDNMFVFRKLNISGMVMLTNRTKYISTFGIILDNYLVD